MSTQAEMTDKPVVTITHRVHPRVIDLLAPHADVVANETDKSWPAEIVRMHCRAADAMIAFMPDSVDDAFLAACPKLRIIACALKGFDNFDVAACTRRGIWITAVPDLLTAPTAELAVGLTIGLARHITAGDRWVRSGAFGGWRPVLYGTGLAGSTVGIVGFGAVGRAIAHRLAGFEARLLFFDPAPTVQEKIASAEAASLDVLLASADIVVLAAPLTPATAGLIGDRALARMKPGALLVNVGRGSVVDEEAVARALTAGRLGGYAADVFAFEDWRLSARPTAIAPALLENTGRTLFTGHMGSAVAAVRLEIEKAAASAVLQVLRGEKPDGALNEINGRARL
jgi:phosphonate dehydrogenase